jgi:serine/threonine protein kinase
VEGIQGTLAARRQVHRYELAGEIGRGGMAVVHRARQCELDRLVALKELSFFRASDTTSRERFLRESRLAGSLAHPNIVTVFDFFEADGTPFIAMEYLTRGSLRPYVGLLGLAQLGAVLGDVLAGLAHAHVRGIVHRDLKPENLLVTDEAV